MEVTKAIFLVKICGKATMCIHSSNSTEPFSDTDFVTKLQVQCK